LTSKGKAVAAALELVHAEEVPEDMGGANGGTFRAGRLVLLVLCGGGTYLGFRFSATSNDVLYTVINTSPKRTKTSKKVTRQAHICKWDVKKWTIERTRKVSDKALTCFAVRCFIQFT